MSSLLPSVAPIIDPNAGPTPSVHSTSLAPVNLQRGQQASSPSGLSALLGSITGSSGVGLLGGLISSGLGMIGDAINFKRQNKLYDKQRTDALADYERQRSDYLSDLASERAYNSPQAQAARLKKAGINPNTVFGSGSVANTSSEAQNQAGFRGSAAPSPVNSGLGSAFAQGFTSASSGQIQSGALDVQAQQMQSNIQLQKAEVIRALSDARFTFSKDERQRIENQFADAMFSSEIKERQARTATLIDSLETTALNRAETLFRINHILPAQVEQIKAAVGKYYTEIRSINQQMSYFDSVKSTRIRSEVEDYKQKVLSRSEKEFRDSIFKALSDRKDAQSIVGDLAFDSAFLLKYLWSFK